MDAASDIQANRLGLAGPMATLLDRAHEGADFLNRVRKGRPAYEAAAKVQGVNLSEVEQRVQALVDAAKAAGVQPPPKKKAASKKKSR